MAPRKKLPRRIEPKFTEPGSPKVRKAARPTAAKNAQGAKKPRKTARRKRKSNGRLGKIFSKTMYWSLVAGVWVTLGGIAIIAWHVMALPQSDMWAIPDRPPNARILAVDGELIANRGLTGGAAMSLGEMSPYIPKAVIAIEDKRFKHHYGVDPIGLARAMAENIWVGRITQGGSTLTQQLAKNLFLKPQRTLQRKVQEAFLAVWLETQFSKDEILELYLNRVYFGSGAYGVAAASRRYFGKSASDVNLAEAAILAAVLKAPSRLSPARNPKLANARAKLVLSAMRQQGYISDLQSAKALTMQAKTAKRFWSGSEHYVADLVMKKASKLIGEMRKDLVIETTIDIDLQKKAGELIKNELARVGKKKKVGQGALVSLDGTGAIRALVGGREYAESQFNRAVDAKRQPGSAFKPFVYLASLEAGRTPGSIRNDAPVKIGKWTPENYDKKYRGEVTLTTALAKSLNTIAAQLVAETGPEAVIETAHRLGIKSKLTSNASIALGTSETSLLEITSAYTPFANGGYKAEPFLIQKITTTEGKVLYQRKSKQPKRVVGGRELAMMNTMLRAVMEFGTGKNARLKNWPTAGKTGTSQNSRDGWFIGYTANITTGLWFGNDDGSPTAKMVGGGLPARTWGKYMAFAHNNVPVLKLPGQNLSHTIPKVRPLVSLTKPQAPSKTLPGLAEMPKARTGQRKVADRSKTNQQITGAVRPSQGLGNSGKKSRTIGDLLFGN